MGNRVDSSYASMCEGRKVVGGWAKSRCEEGEIGVGWGDSGDRSCGIAAVEVDGAGVDVWIVFSRDSRVSTTEAKEATVS